MFGELSDFFLQFFKKGNVCQRIKKKENICIKKKENSLSKIPQCLHCDMCNMQLIFWKIEYNDIQVVILLKIEIAWCK